MPTVIDEQVRRLQDALALGAINKEALARRAGIRKSTLTGMSDPDWNPTRRTLSALVQVLDDLGIGESGRSKKR